MQQPESTTPQYEFNESENTVFSGLSTAMRVVGTVALGLGALMVAGFFALVFTHRIGQAALSVTLGMVMITTGLWNRDIARPVESIVTSQGSDISHLMEAMGKLKKIYSLQQTLLLCAILMVGLSFFIGLSGGH